MDAMEKIKNEEIEEITLLEVITAIVEVTVEDLVKKLKKERMLVLDGARTGETGREHPDKRVDFSKLSYGELCAFLDDNPKARL